MQRAKEISMRWKSGWYDSTKNVFPSYRWIFSQLRRAFWLSFFRSSTGTSPNTCNEQKLFVEVCCTTPRAPLRSCRFACRSSSSNRWQLFTRVARAGGRALFLWIGSSTFCVWAFLMLIAWVCFTCHVWENILYPLWKHEIPETKGQHGVNRINVRVCEF